MESNNQENTFLSREELTSRLLMIAEKNRASISLFAARCAIRIMPLLASDPLLKYWHSESLGDLRAINFISLWRAVLSGVLHKSSNRAAIRAARAARMAASYGSISSLAAAAASCAAHVADTVDAEDSTYAVRAAYSAATTYTPFYNAMTNDVIRMENGEDLTDLPLWHKPSHDSAYTKASKEWKNLIYRLAKEDAEKSPLRSNLIAKFSEIYSKIHDGSYSKEYIQQILLELDSYYISIESQQPEEKGQSSSSKKTIKSKKESPHKNLPSDPVSNEEKSSPTIETSTSTLNKNETINENYSPTYQFTPSRQQAAEAISEEDHLNRKKLVETLASFLAHPANYHHQTIGLLGDWGVGKSSFIHLLKESILKNHADQPFLFGEFNAWAYENTDNLQAGIAQEIIKALSSPESKLDDFKRKPKQPKTLATAIQTEWSNFKKTLSWSVERSLLVIRFAITLNGPKILWLLILIFIATSPWNPLFINFFNHLLTKITASNDLDPLIATGGRILWAGGFLFYLGKELQKLLANPMAKELLTYIRLPDYAKHLGTIPQMRKNIETLCRVRLQTDSEKSKRLLFVVDDLDRCGHQAIVKVLEAVRLVLDIQNVMVVIAVDQRIALSALALHYKDFAQYHNSKDSRSIARDYLAKVIHLPITLYKPKGEDIKAYLNFIWSQMITEEHKTILKKATPPAIGETTPDNTQSAKNNSEEKPTNQPRPQPSLGDEKTLHKEVQLTTKPTTTKTKIPEESPTNGQAEPTIIASLSEDHQKAFLYWVDYFELSNPRQVKRLNNSYNLLHSYYDYDSVPLSYSLKETNKQVTVFPMMLALFIMEYLNTLDDQLLRIKIKVALRKTDSKTETENTAADTKIDSTLISIDIMQLVHRWEETLKTDFIKIVEPFVLPAIECH